MIDLSIIIVTYNPGKIFLDCLKSIADGVGNLAYEIIVVDNASQDGIPQQAAAMFPAAKFIFNLDNKGFAGGNNQGLAIAQGQFLLLLNPDVVVQPDSLSTLVEFLRHNPSVGIVGPRTLDANGKISLTANAVYTPLTILWQYIGLDRLFPNIIYGRFRHATQTAVEPFEVAWVQGCCLLFKYEVYQQIGGLDEGFFLFAEEPDFCERALQAAWTTMFIPQSVISHLESNSVSKYPERKIRNYHISPLYYFRKRRKELHVVMLKIGFTFELALKMMARVFYGLYRKNPTSFTALYGRVLREVWRY